MASKTVTYTYTEIASIIKAHLGVAGQATVTPNIACMPFVTGINGNPSPGMSFALVGVTVAYDDVASGIAIDKLLGENNARS